MIRLHQTGPNHRGDNFLEICVVCSPTSIFQASEKPADRISAHGKRAGSTLVHFSQPRPADRLDSAFADLLCPAIRRLAVSRGSSGRKRLFSPPLLVMFPSNLQQQRPDACNRFLCFQTTHPNQAPRLCHFRLGSRSRTGTGKRWTVLG
jgi:hypothetical protein